VSSAVAKATVTISDDKGEQKGSVSLAGGKGSTVVSLKNPRPWSPEDPHLYTLTIRLENGATPDEYALKIGVRTIEARGDKLLLNGKPVRNVGDLVPADAKARLRHAEVVTSSIAPSMMPAGERRKLLSWPLPPEGDAFARSMWKHVDTVRQGLTVEACYCSLFDECWRTKAQADIPKPVATCEIGKHFSYQG